MPNVAERKQLPIWEITTDDGGKGLKIGEDGPIHMGYDESDLLRLLEAIFPDRGACGADWRDLPPVDGDLIDLAKLYLDSPISAYERQHELNEDAGWREW